MSFKEVNELRKSGHLEEALQMANADLENEKNPWTYRALFWVLHDKCKQHMNDEQKDEATAIVERMKEIMPLMENDQDSLAQQQLGFLEQQLSPVISAIRQADQDSRDEHKVEQAFNAIKNFIDDKTIELNSYQQTTLGWIVYRYAKHELDKKLSYNVRLALSLYFKLETERPSLLHSSILRIAVDLEKDFNKDFKFTAFFKMWGFENFNDEDWDRFTTEGGIAVPSLAEKAIGRYCKELVDDHINAVPDEFVQLIETARKKLHGDGKIELNYARVLAVRGDVEQAVKAYQKVTEKLPQPYVWQEMANIIPDRDIKLAILCKVIKMQHEEQYLGDTRLHLAQMLIEDGDYAAAKCELDIYHQAKQQKGWSVKDPYYELVGRIPLGTQGNANNKELYDSKMECLVSFMYPNAKTAVMIYNGRPITNKQGKPRAKLVADDGTVIQVSPKRLPRHPSRQQYYFYTVKYAKIQRGFEPLEIKPLDSQEGLTHFQVVTGEIRIKTRPDGTRFGFVNNCYVHQSLLDSVNDGQRIQVIATKSQDDRLNAVVVEVLK